MHIKYPFYLGTSKCHPKRTALGLEAAGHNYLALKACLTEAGYEVRVITTRPPYRIDHEGLQLGPLCLSSDQVLCPAIPNMISDISRFAGVKGGDSLCKVRCFAPERPICEDSRVISSREDSIREESFIAVCKCRQDIRSDQRLLYKNSCPGGNTQPTLGAAVAILFHVIYTALSKNTLRPQLEC